MAEANTTPTPGEITAIAGGGVAVIASFLDFINDESAWASFFFPLATLIALFSAVVAVQVALDRFANVRGGPGVAGLTWTQVNLLFGFFAVVLALAWLIADIGPSDREIGYWGMAIGAVAVFVGSILMVRERSGSTTQPPSNQPPAA